MRPRLSKSRLMASLQCRRRLWLQVHRRDLAQVSAQSEAGFARGHRVGEIARQLFPGGHLIESVDNLSQALRMTERALSAPGDLTLFEPAFRHRGLLVRADVLERRNGRHRLVEVKSSTEVKPYHPADIAIQAWAIQGAGVALGQVELAHIDTDFAYAGNGDYHGLFRHVEMAEAILPLQAQIPLWIAAAERSLAGPMPNIGVGPHCNDPYECEFLGFCAPVPAEYPVDVLPNAAKLIEALKAEGYADLRDVPADRLTSGTHQRIRRAAVSGEPEQDPSAGEKLAALGYPRYFLDFETVMPAVPVWANTRPYRHVPIQWSCHRVDDDGKLTHRRFLATDGADPRRRFAESLIEAVETNGPVFAYNAAFEGRQLSELAELFADLAADLLAIRARLFDLWPFTKAHYCHPAMKGSWSLKAVVSTVAPDLDYANLDHVQSGDMVEAIYFEMVDPGTAVERRMELQTALLRYCERDTLALVRLVEHFGRDPCPATERAVRSTTDE